MVKEIRCDVLVVGAGLSGVAAAIAASERGAKAVLLEQNRFLGGTVIAGMHRYLCGLYGAAAARTLNGGIARDIVSRLRGLSARNRPLRLGKVYVLAFRSKDLEACLRELIKKRKGLKVILNSRAYALTQERGCIREVRAMGKGRIFSIRPRVVIDASGEGAVIKLSKAGHRIASCGRRQLAGFSFRVKGVKDTGGLLPIKIPYYIRCAAYAALDNRSEGVIRLNIPAGRGTPGLKKEARKVVRYLRTVLPEFKAAHIAAFSPSVVEREGISLAGAYALTARDVLQARKFEDGVVKNSWPIEMWGPKKGPQYRYLGPGRFYEIPLRCLKSKKIKNLLACGRCISVTREALGSTRAAGTCIALGEQAGIVAVKLCASY